MCVCDLVLCASGVDPHSHTHTCCSWSRCGRSSTSCRRRRTGPVCLACHSSCRARSTPVRKTCTMPSGSRCPGWPALCLLRRPATTHRTGELRSTSRHFTNNGRLCILSLAQGSRVNLCSSLLETSFSVTTLLNHKTVDPN